MRRLMVSVSVVAAVCAAPAIARAEEVFPAFGSEGQLVVSDLLGVRSSGIGYLGVMSPSGSALGQVPVLSGLVGFAHDESTVAQGFPSIRSVWNTVSVAPSLDVFVARRLSIGAMVGYSYSHQTLTAPAGLGVLGAPNETATLFAIAPRLGYVVPLGHGLFVWPRLGGAYSYAHIEQGAPRTLSVQRALTVGADVGLVYQPIRNVYLSAAPEISLSSLEVETQQATLGMSTEESVRVRLAGTVAMGLVL